MSVEHIYSRGVAGGPRIEHGRIRVAAGQGILGDRYFGKDDEPGQKFDLAV